MKYNHFGGVNEEGAIAEMEITFFTACDLEKVEKKYQQASSGLVISEGVGWCGVAGKGEGEC